MKHTITKDGYTQPMDERNLKLYLKLGWKLIEVKQPKNKVDKSYKRLTRQQLISLCEEKGIKTDDSDTRAILISKLDIVTNRIDIKPTITNKEFRDSLIIE